MGQSQEYGDKRLPITEQGYLSLVDWTVRYTREDKRSHIPNNIPLFLTVST